MDLQSNPLITAHDRFAFALVMSSGLAVALKCQEEQVWIQDIYNGQTGTHINVCFTSNETHNICAQDLGQKIIRDVQDRLSDLLFLLPHLICVSWMPYQATNGLSTRYQSEHTHATTRSQLSYLDTQRAVEDRQPMNLPREISTGGILRDQVHVSVANHNRLGSVPDEKWNKLSKQHVTMNPRILKIAEANQIFNKLDRDGSGTLSCSEIFVGMLTNGFDEKEIIARLPAVFNAMDAGSNSELSRQEFVDFWVCSRDEDPTRLFDRLDVDKNGELSIMELRAGLIQEGFEDKEIEYHLPIIFRRMDSDKNGSISKAEFVSHWKSVKSYGRSILSQIAGVQSWARKPGQALQTAGQLQLPSLPEIPLTSNLFQTTFSNSLGIFGSNSCAEDENEMQEPQVAPVTLNFCRTRLPAFDWFCAYA